MNINSKMYLGYFYVKEAIYWFINRIAFLYNKLCFKFLFINGSFFA